MNLKLRILGSLKTTIIKVFWVNSSIKAVNKEFLTATDLIYA